MSKLHFEAMKEKVGMASYGTSEYWLASAKILSQWADQEGGIRSDTKAKLEALAQSSDPETRNIAEDAMRGTRYCEYEEANETSNYDSDDETCPDCGRDPCISAHGIDCG